jgi:hypothetical protein
MIPTCFSNRFAACLNRWFCFLYGESQLLAKLDTPGASITEVAFPCQMRHGVEENCVKLAGVHAFAAAVALCLIQHDDPGVLLEFEGVLWTNRDAGRFWALHADNRSTGQRMGKGDTDVGSQGAEHSGMNHGANDFAGFAAGAFLLIY